MANRCPLGMRIASVFSFLSMVFTLSAQNVPQAAQSQPAGPGIERFLATPHGTTDSGLLPMTTANPLFFPVVVYNSSLTSYYRSVAAADLNGDGKFDVVAANEGTYQTVSQDGWVDVFLGNGDGTLQSPVSFDAGGTYAESVKIVDLDGDGKPDLVITSACASGTSGVGCSSEGVVGILMGKGDGTFKAVVTYGSGGSGYGGSEVVVADVNGDGKPDLLVSSAEPIGNPVNSSGPGVVAVLLGNGDGTFQPAVPYSSGGYAASSVTLADVNGDGKPDLIVGNACVTACNDSTAEGTVGVLLGNGNGTFQPAVSYDSGGVLTVSVAVADVNHDGKLDILTANCGPWFCGPGSPGGNAGVLLGNGDGTFQAAVPYAAANAPDGIVGTDVNGDGKPDLVISNWGTVDAGTNAGTISVLLGNGDGTFQPVSSYSSGNGEADSIAVVDLNHDGWPDLVVGTYSGLAVFLNVGKHIFSATTLAASLDPSVINQLVTFTATVSLTSGNPAGKVIFSDGSTVLGTARLSHGSALFSTSSLQAGVHSITAAYQGSGNFLPSSSPALNQLVLEPPTVTSLTTSAPTVPLNQLVTYSVTVTNQSGATITGSVNFNDNGHKIAVVALVNGHAACSLAYPKAGKHVMTAYYPGDANNDASLSPALNEYVAVLPVATTTVVTASASPVFIGQPVTLTAVVASKDGVVPDGELVTFSADGTSIGAVGTTSGVATLTTSSLSAKNHGIRASYSGDAIFLPSAGTNHVAVNLYATATVLASSPNPSAVGQAVTFTASVTSNGSSLPTGKVLFRDGTKSIGTVVLSGGVATLTKSNLSAGSHSITAKYEGDTVSGQSTSADLSQVVH
jgi:hypothetical protein